MTIQTHRNSIVPYLKANDFLVVMLALFIGLIRPS